MEPDAPPPNACVCIPADAFNELVDVRERYGLYVVEILRDTDASVPLTAVLVMGDIIPGLGGVVGTVLSRGGLDADFRLNVCDARRG